MKTLYVIFSELGLCFRARRFFIVTVCLGFFTCGLTFLYLYGIWRAAAEAEPVPAAVMYPVGETVAEPEETEAVLRGLRAEVDYYAAVRTYGDGGKETPEYPIRARGDGSGFFVSTGNAKRLKERGTVIVPEGWEGPGIGETVILNGVPLEVVGTSVIPAFLVSAVTFADCVPVPDCITVAVPAGNVKKAEEALRAAFGSSFRIEAAVWEGKEGSETTVLYAASAVYLLCAASFLYLTVSVYGGNALRYDLYETLGATRGKTVLILLAVTAVPITASLLLAAAVYFAFFRRFSGGLFSPADLPTFFLATLLPALLAEFLYFLRRTRGTPAERAARNAE